MKLALNLCLFLVVFLILGNKSLSLTNYQIKKTCRVEKNKSKCLKKLQEKRINLQKGNLIEIPVIPFKR